MPKTLGSHVPAMLDLTGGGSSQLPQVKHETETRGVDNSAGKTCDRGTPSPSSPVIRKTPEHDQHAILRLSGGEACEHSGSRKPDGSDTLRDERRPKPIVRRDTQPKIDESIKKHPGWRHFLGKR